MSREESVLININSAYGEQQNGSMLSSMWFPFPGLLINDGDVETAYISVRSAQIPYVSYNITAAGSGNKLSCQYGFHPHVDVITIPEGSYTASSLAAEITRQGAAAGWDGWYADYNPSTGKWFYGVSPLATWSLRYTNTGGDMRNWLGFPGETSLSPDAEGFLYGESIVSFIGSLQVRVLSSYLACVSFDSIAGNNTLLCSIPIACGNFEMLMYENQSYDRTRLLVKDLEGFDILLQDDHGELMDCRGLHWNMVMVLTVVRRQSTNYFANFPAPVLEPAATAEELQQQEIPQPPPTPIDTTEGTITDLFLREGVVLD